MAAERAQRRSRRGRARSRGRPAGPPRRRVPRRSTAPSTRRRRWRARRPIAGSCVTTTSVSPRAFMLLEELRRSRSRRPCRDCRSARRPAAATGPMTTARAIATRWRSPPESCSAQVLGAARTGRRRRARERRARARSAALDSREDHRQLDVARGGQPRDEMVELEHEADPVPADLRERVVVEAAPPRGRRGGRSRWSAGRDSRGC